MMAYDRVPFEAIQPILLVLLDRTEGADKGLIVGSLVSFVANQVVNVTVATELPMSRSYFSPRTKCSAPGFF